MPRLSLNHRTTRLPNNDDDFYGKTFHTAEDHPPFLHLTVWPTGMVDEATDAAHTVAVDDQSAAQV